MDDKDVIIAAQAALIAEQDRLIGALREQIQKLEEKIASLKKNSHNSSKPPSSDIVKPDRGPRRRGKRKRGGQPGHRKFTRAPFPPEQVDRVEVIELPPEKAAGLVKLDTYAVLQQVELPKKMYRVTEYRACQYFNPVTGRIITTPLPPLIRQAGLCGARLSALVAFLKSSCHGSFGTIQRFCGEVLHLRISTGQLAKVIQKVAQALRQPYQALQAQLPNEPALGSDETGHHDRGKLHWLWCLQTARFDFFHINRSRGSKVLRKLLGRHFKGVVHSDYYSSYRKFARLARALMQYCLAHLIRELRFLAEHHLQSLVRWAKKLLGWLRKMFKLWHQREQSNPEKVRAGLVRLREQFLQVMRRPPRHPLARKLARRFQGTRAEDYFRFIERPGLEPTNNATERALRGAVIDRKVTQGTCGQPGMRWRERSWTVLGTCRKQNRNVLTYLHQALRAHWQGQPAPQLI